MSSLYLHPPGLDALKSGIPAETMTLVPPTAAEAESSTEGTLAASLNVPTVNLSASNLSDHSSEMSSFKRKVSQQLCGSFGLTKHPEFEDPLLRVADDAISRELGWAGLLSGLLRIWDIAGGTNAAFRQFLLQRRA